MINDSDGVVKTRPLQFPWVSSRSAAKIVPYEPVGFTRLDEPMEPTSAVAAVAVHQMLSMGHALYGPITRPTNSPKPRQTFLRLIMESLTLSPSPAPIIASGAGAGASPLSLFSPSGVPLSSRPRPSLLLLTSKNRKSGSDLSPGDGESSESAALVPLPHHRRASSLSPLSKDAAMGLVLSAAAGQGWTTGSGMEGPSSPASPTANATENISTFPWSLFTKSPRRRMRVAFTCNVCGQRTTRAINPHAYTDGTVFVQCCGCNIFHKLVDNLNLFHEMKCYVNPSFRYRNPEGDGPFNLFDFDGDDGNDVFPLI